MWYRLVSAAAGIWLMAAPAVLSYGAPASTSDRIVGPLIVANAIVAIWEPTRELRRVNTVLGAWLIVAPWLLGYEGSAIVSSMAAGVVVLVMSLLRGKVKGDYGGGWSVLWRGQNAAD